MDENNAIYTNWVKKLGQHHLSEIGKPVTLCGMPMLGNNYWGQIPEDELRPCEQCFEKRDRDSEIDVDEIEDEFPRPINGNEWDYIEENHFSPRVVEHLGLTLMRNGESLFVVLSYDDTQSIGNAAEIGSLFTDHEPFDGLIRPTIAYQPEGLQIEMRMFPEGWEEK